MSMSSSRKRQILRVIWLGVISAIGLTYFADCRSLVSDMSRKIRPVSRSNHYTDAVQLPRRLGRSGPIPKSGDRMY